MIKGIYSHFINKILLIALLLVVGVAHTGSFAINQCINSGQGDWYDCKEWDDFGMLGTGDVAQDYVEPDTAGSGGASDNSGSSGSSSSGGSGAIIGSLLWILLDDDDENELQMNSYIHNNYAMFQIKHIFYLNFEKTQQLIHTYKTNNIDNDNEQLSVKYVLTF